MKIRLVVAELFHADRRTDISKLIVAFRSFANAPKNYLSTTFRYRIGPCPEAKNKVTGPRGCLCYLNCYRVCVMSG
jgi:hypothetical protein